MKEIEKHLKIENEQLMEKIETLNNKILELENNLYHQRKPQNK